MVLRLTTWNVNGIRNPFAYEPWRGNRSFEWMFDTLEADIVVLQEAKIQKKDLQDDMVLISGWDCFFSLPKNKKGYSGVAIYTRNSKCSAIRSEEGLTGILCPPNSSTAFRDLPAPEQIGGYPTPEQLELSAVNPTTLDSEGRCIILEFPAFVLLGVYCPANRGESRDDFRLGFLNILDARVRNLIRMGKRVVLMGDLNISSTLIDSAPGTEATRKGATTEDEFASSPHRRLFRDWIDGGPVVGDDDGERKCPVLLDICRNFHPQRTGMFTCWEQRVNARPGNYGSRIDYVLCSLDMRDWFAESDIQEGLMGSDHCPVYAVIKDKVIVDGKDTDIVDIMNPAGTFVNGVREQEYSLKNLLPLSGRLMPEFNRRRTIKDMFRKPPPKNKGVRSPFMVDQGNREPESSLEDTKSVSSAEVGTGASTPELKGQPAKRPNKKEDQASQSKKRPKLRSGISSSRSNGQQTLTGFVKSNKTGDIKINDTITSQENIQDSADVACQDQSNLSQHSNNSKTDPTLQSSSTTTAMSAETSCSPMKVPATLSHPTPSSSDSKESWSKLFAKKSVPRCEGHGEDCISLMAKKPGMNCGRSFWICPRPLGPSGTKVVGTPWRCPTFIWCSEWRASS